MIRKNKWLVAAAAVLILVTAFAAGHTVTANARIVKGNTEQNVRLVQERLAELGFYKTKVDGVFGPKSTAAVKAFQKSRGLIADGVVGAKTEAALGITLTRGGSVTAGSVSDSDLNLLARCVYAEARGEPYTGQVAVAAVVLNRVRAAGFPNSIAGVIYQPWAFTAVNDGQINLKPNDNAKKAARDALNGWDPTNGCLYYFNPATATSKWIWSLTVEMRIGRHAFARR
jgi:N-acetylmuramoyl-L-alanine amidase